MYLSAQEIAESRDHALNNLLGLSGACLEAGRRLSELLSSTGREAIHYGSKQWSLFGHGQVETMTQFPASLWLENSARTSRLLDNTLEIVGATHKAMIRSAEAQVRVFDDIAFTTIDRAVRSSPWEIEIGLRAVKTTLQAAESTLHDINAAAIETIDPAASQGRQPIASAVETRPAPRKRNVARPTPSQ